MITLNDAVNRNYYFYQGSGDVRVEFLKGVFNTFLGYDFNNFVRNKANYWMKQGMTRSDAFRKAYHQAVETAIRACIALPKYRREIKIKFGENPGLRGGITDEVIENMKYNELSTLRTNLGLNRRGKKVKTTEPAPKKTVEKAKEIIKEEPIAKTVAKAFEPIQPSFEDLYPEAFKPEPHHEIEEFYSVEEARQAYPGYTKEELAEVGIQVTDEDADEKLDRYSIIDQILSYDLTIEGRELTINMLANLNKEDLLAVYNTVRMLNRVSRKEHTK